MSNTRDTALEYIGGSGSGPTCWDCGGPRRRGEPHACLPPVPDYLRPPGGTGGWSVEVAALREQVAALEVRLEETRGCAFVEINRLQERVAELEAQLAELAPLIEAVRKLQE